MQIKKGLFILVLTLAFIGCKKKQNPKAKKQVHHTKGKSTTQGYPAQAKDERGKLIVLEKKPKRIVVGGTPLYTEIVIDLGAKDRLVGITNSSDNPPEAKGIPLVGPSWPLNIEKVLSLRPDLVLCAMAKFRDKLEKDAKMKVFTGGRKHGSLTSLQDIYTLITRLDTLLYGNQKRSQKLLKKLKAKLKALSAKVDKKTTQKVGIFYVPKEQSQRIYVTHSKSPAHELLQMAGGKNVFAEMKGSAASIELLLTKNPDIIITDPKHVSRVYNHRSLKSLKAVKNKKVFGIRASHYTSSRMDKVLKRLIRYLHPNQKKASK